MASATYIDSFFRGDGQYVFDGGTSLQSLWDAYSWREIRNCPGRYVCSSQHLKQRTPTELVLTVDSSACLHEFNIDGKDPITVCRFRGGGGLMTYTKVKQPGGGKGEGLWASGPSILFVHTLNTESGLIRKIDALPGIEPSDVHFRSKHAASRFILIRTILTFLEDQDKNASATTLVRRFSRALSPSA
jgi:hypothetical protein